MQEHGGGGGGEELWKERDTYGLLNLSLVSLQLVLEFLHQLLHALISLVVLLRLEDQLLQAPFVFVQDFHRLHVTLLFGVQLGLQLLNLKSERRRRVSAAWAQDGPSNWAANSAWEILCAFSAKAGIGYSFWPTHIRIMGGGGI